MARQALDRLDDLAEVASKDSVARNLGLPRRVEGPGCACQMRCAANAASSGCDDKAGLRVLVAKDDLEAAEQLGVGPCVDDDAVLDVDTHVEIAFDATDRRNIEGLYSLHWRSLSQE